MQIFRAILTVTVLAAVTAGAFLLANVLMDEDEAVLEGE